jgi:hypothetical protein
MPRFFVEFRRLPFIATKPNEPSPSPWPRLPGQPEVNAAAATAKHGGLIFPKAEMEAFSEIAKECGAKRWDSTAFQRVEQ